MIRLPELQKSDRYIGLYVVDFGDHCGVGFTAEEVAELLDSEKFKDVKVYKIHRAYPDGKLELKGMPHSIFELEAGMFFYCDTLKEARSDFAGLVRLGKSSLPPCRAKVHLARYSSDKYITAIIYPAEYEDEVSRWLVDGEYVTRGLAEGGTGAVQRYYDSNLEVLDRKQLFGSAQYQSRTGTELLERTKLAVQR